MNSYEEILRTVHNVRKEKEVLENLSKSRFFFKEGKTLVDKFGIGFNLDSRFSTSDGFKISLDAWEGHYGNSGSSTPFSFESDRFRRVFTDVINENMEFIFKKMAEKYSGIEKEKISDIDKKINELQELREKIVKKDENQNQENQ